MPILDNLEKEVNRWAWIWKDESNYTKWYLVSSVLIVLLDIDCKPQYSVTNN